MDEVIHHLAVFISRLWQIHVFKEGNTRTTAVFLNGIYETTEFLEMFLRNLLLNEKHELHNREMHVSGKFFLGHDDQINDPINDPIKLDGRELKIIELLRE